MKKDNIEDIYSGLEGFSKVPPKDLWDNIETRLYPKKRKRRGILFLWGSAAAVLVLFAGYVINNSLEPNNKPVNEITDIEHRVDDDTVNDSEVQTNTIVDETFTSKVKDDSLLKGSNHIKESLNNSLASQQQLSDSEQVLNRKGERNPTAKSFYKKNKNGKEENSKNNSSYAQNTEKKNSGEVIKNDVLVLQKKSGDLINYKKEKAIASYDSISLNKASYPIDLAEKLIVENKGVSDTINNNTIESSKWSLEILGGLSNTVSESSIQGTSVSTVSQNDFVYTLKVGYSITDRLVVKSGIGKNILGQEVNNVKYVAADVSYSADNSVSIVNNQTLVFLFSDALVNDVTSAETIINEGILQQQFNYIQIPLEVSYDLLKQQKYNLSLGIGGNVNFLTNNRAFLNDEQIGESLGVDSTIFGATVNSNISYNLAKKTILFIEPSYNYFQRPIDNNNQTFNNTQFRVLFGVRYKF